MKTLLTLITIIFITNTWAQQLPRKSCKSKVEQQIGLTNVSIEYSRPKVNGRNVFGELVPFGEVWRLGANEPTKIEINYPISINGQKLDTGTYAIFAIPSENQWTIVFNTDYKQWGSSDYQSDKNVLEYTTAVNGSDFTESFTISFESVDETSALLTFAWDNVKVSVPLTTDTKNAVQASIDKAVEKGEDLSGVYSKAADYFIKNGDLNTAKEYLEKSLDIERNYKNVYLSATILKDEDLKDAKKMAEEAIKLAVESNKQGWADYIKKKSEEWK